MNAAALLEELHQRGAIVEVDGERLLIDAPKGAVTNDLRTALTEQKDDLLHLLRADALKARWLAAWHATRAAVREGRDADADVSYATWAAIDDELRTLVGYDEYVKWADAVAPIDGHWL